MYYFYSLISSFYSCFVFFITKTLYSVLVPNILHFNLCFYFFLSGFCFLFNLLLIVSLFYYLVFIFTPTCRILLESNVSFWFDGHRSILQHFNITWMYLNFLLCFLATPIDCVVNNIP